MPHAAGGVNPPTWMQPNCNPPSACARDADHGSSRFMVRGMGVSRVTNLATGLVHNFQGGGRLTFVFAADGSMRVDGSGTDIIAWYFVGDDADVGPGVFDINGRLSEWYAPDGSFIRATFDGTATNLCDLLGT